MVDAYREIAPTVEDVREYAARTVDWAETGPTEVHHEVDHDPDVWASRRRQAIHGADSEAPTIPSTTVARFASISVRSKVRALDGACIDRPLAVEEESHYLDPDSYEGAVRHWRGRQHDHGSRCVQLCDACPAAWQR